MITHRLNTVSNADRILVVDAGVVAEQGSHDDLLARGGLYAELLVRASPRPVLAHAR